MEIDIKPETIAFLIMDFEEILQHCDIEETVFEDIANLLNLLANMQRGSTIHVNL